MKVDLGKTVQGSRVQIEAVTMSDSLRIGDVIAFDPAESSETQVVGLQVKRIAALPGQELRISEGDLWLDGRRHCKSISDYNQVAIKIDSLVATSGRWIEYYPTSLYPRVVQSLNPTLFH